MALALFLFCITLLSIPAYRILNAGQICLFIISSIVILAYYLKRSLLGKELTAKFPIYLMAIIVTSVSYNLKAEKGWIGYIPFAQLLVTLIFLIYILVANRRKRNDVTQVVGRKDGRLVFVFFCIATVFAALAIAGWANFLSADIFYEQGVIRLKYGRTDLAERIFTKAIDKRPNLYFGYQKLCNILYKEGQYDEVINVCKKGLPYLRMTADHYDIFCFYLGSSYFRKERPDEAFSYYDKLMAVDRGGFLEKEFSIWPEFSFYKGYRYSKSKRWDEAIKEYKKVLLTDPKSFITRFKIGEAYYFTGRSENALKIFDYLINSGFSYRDTFLYIAVLYERANMFDKAIVMYERYATMDPGKDRAKEAYFRGCEKIGQIYERMGMKDEAINTYKKLLLLKDRSAEAYYLLGNAYCQFRMEKEAEEAYQKAMKIDRRNKRGYYELAAKELGSIYEARQNWEEAMRLYKSIIARGSKEAFCYIGDLYLKRGMWDEANRAYDEAYQAVPGIPYILAGPYQQLMKKYEEQGRQDKVFGVAEKLITIGPEWIVGKKDEWERISLRFIELCYKQGNRGKLNKIYKIILSSYPKGEDPSELLAKIRNINKTITNKALRENK